MTTRADLQEYLKNANVQAFLRMIRLGEGTNDPKGYLRLFGGGNFRQWTPEESADHPNILVTKKSGDKEIKSTAAGAYQFLNRTWKALVKQYGFTDFLPPSQDEGAVALIIGRGAIDDVVAGRIEEAIAKCNQEWASLPGSKYGQPTISLVAAVNEFTKYGGTRSGQEMPTRGQFNPLQPSPDNISITETEAPKMAPFIAAALPALINAAPSLIRIFGDSPVAERNAQAAEKVVEIAKQVTGATSSEEAVNMIQSDPSVASVFNKEAESKFLELEAMADRRVEAARVFNAGEEPLFKASWGSVKFVHLLSTLVVVAAILAIGYIIMTSQDPTERSMALQTLLLGGLGGVMSYWLGSSNGSDKKTDILEKR